MISCARSSSKLTLMVFVGLLFSCSISIAAPSRIVSLNPCLDQILVEVADPQHIAALSHYSSDPRSSLIAETAHRFPSTYGSAEEVTQLKPDLVLASEYSSQSTLKTLTKLHTPLALFELPNSIEISTQQVTRIAALVGHPERGEALNRRIDAALQQAKAPSGDLPINALVYQANGFVAGKGTLIDEVMTRAGFQNQASVYGIAQWGTVHLEDILLKPPKVLFTPSIQHDAGAWSSRMIAHPILKHLPHHIMRESPFPESLLYCGGPTLIPLSLAFSQAHSREKVLP